MSFFKRLFGADKAQENVTQTTWEIPVLSIERLTPSAVKVVFDLPEDAAQAFQYIPGQYLNVGVIINGSKHQRSYSICSAPHEPLAIGVKQVENGLVSSFINTDLKPGDTLLLDVPNGNFRLTDIGGNYVAFAAGSGITPILSMLKTISTSNQGSIKLFYGNKSPEQTMFLKDIEELNQKQQISATLVYSQYGETKSRISDEFVKAIIKSDLDLLKKDGFFICGPEEMIVSVAEALKLFGVADDKIYFELFTAPTLIQSKTKVVADFKGVSHVEIILDGEKVSFDLASDGPRIIDALDEQGIDAPYSCRGGVCCTCRGKILEGSATMDHNLALTDKEVAEGYVLTCQAHPTSEKLIISFDE
jgi:ring-1,2-phenylacetyl-CoA epoxidase subunit PaaE